MRTRSAFFILASVISGVISGGSLGGAGPFEAPAASAQVFEPIPPLPAADPARVRLGSRLFHDPRLSSDDRVSCAECHRLRMGGMDRMARSIGVSGAVGDANTPTVFNAALNPFQFWDGRARTLEEQMDGPIHNPKEMGSGWPEIVGKLSSDARYSASFASLYPDGIRERNVRDAIATFERSLLTPSRFDRLLHGDATALTASERLGFETFKRVGCSGCHDGVNLGGHRFSKAGIRPGDATVFRVAPLRNVAITAPYFHDASARTLPEAIRIMGRNQSGVELTHEEVDGIGAFLGSLTGTYAGRTLPFDRPAAE